MCVVGLGVSPGIRIRLTNLMATFHTLYAVNYLGTAERVFELVFPSSHAWKCSFSCEDSCSVPTVVYVAEGGRLRTCGLNPRPFLLWPFFFFSPFFPPPPHLRWSPSFCPVHRKTEWLFFKDLCLAVYALFRLLIECNCIQDMSCSIWMYTCLIVLILRLKTWHCGMCVSFKRRITLV